MKFGTMFMRKVENFEVGDIVAFENEKLNYQIEDIEITAIGKIRHTFNDGTASNSYWPGEILYAPE